MLYGYAIIIKRNGQDGSKYPLTTREIKIGKLPGCQILINTPYVSKEHCSLIVKDDEKVYVKPLSKAPVIVNDVALTSEAPLEHGDVFDVGGRLLRWEYLSSAGALKTQLKRKSLSTPGKAIQSPNIKASTPDRVRLLVKSNTGRKSLQVNKLNLNPTNRRKSEAISSRTGKSPHIKTSTPQSLKARHINEAVTGRKSLQATKLLFSPVCNRRKSDAIRNMSVNDWEKLTNRVTSANDIKSSPLGRKDTPIKRISPTARAGKRGISIKDALVPIKELPGTPKTTRDTLLENSDYETPPEVKTPSGSPKARRSRASPLKSPPNLILDGSITTPPEVMTPFDSPSPSPSKKRSSSFVEESPAKRVLRTTLSSPNKPLTPCIVSMFDLLNSHKANSNEKIIKTPSASNSSKMTPIDHTSYTRTPNNSSGHYSPKSTASDRKTPVNGNSSASKGRGVSKTPDSSVSIKRSPSILKTPGENRSSSAKKTRFGLTTLITPLEAGNINDPIESRKSPTVPKTSSPLKKINQPGPSIDLIPVDGNQLKGEINTKMSRLLSNSKIRGKKHDVNLKNKLVKKAIKVSTKILKTKIKPPIANQLSLGLPLVAGRRSSKRISGSKPVVRPDYTELSPTALGLTPRLQLSPLEPISNKSRKSRTSPGTRDASFLFVTPNISQDVFVSPLTNSILPGSAALTPNSSRISSRSNAYINHSIQASTESEREQITENESSTTSSRTSQKLSPGVSKSIKKQNSPRNDLTSIPSIRKLMKTPPAQKKKGEPKSKKVIDQKSPRNDLTDIPSIRRLLKTPPVQKKKSELKPKSVIKQKSPRNDLTAIPSIRRLLKTPPVQKKKAEPKSKSITKQKSPRNDLTAIPSIRRLLKTPPVPKKKSELKPKSVIKQKSPRNDLTAIPSIRRLLKTPPVQKKKAEPKSKSITKQKSPRNDLTAIPSIRKLMKTPPVQKKKAGQKSKSVTKQKSPRNDLTSIPSIRLLMKTPPTKTKKIVVAGVKRHRSSEAKQSPDLTGIENLFASPPRSSKLSPVRKRVTRLATGTPSGASTPVHTPKVRATRSRKVTAPTEDADTNKVQMLTEATDESSSGTGRRKPNAAETPAKTRARRKAASPRSPTSSPAIKPSQTRRQRAAAVATSSEDDENVITTRRMRGVTKPQSPANVSASLPAVVLKARGAKIAAVAAMSPKVNKSKKRPSTSPEADSAISPSPKKKTRSAVKKATVSPKVKTRATRKAPATKASPSPKRTRSRAAAARK